MPPAPAVSEAWVERLVPDAAPLGALFGPGPGAGNAESDSEEDDATYELDDEEDVLDAALAEVYEDEAAEAAAAAVASGGGHDGSGRDGVPAAPLPEQVLAGVFATGHALEGGVVSAERSLMMAQAVCEVCSATEQLRAQAKEMAAYGLPEDLSKWSCCSRCCIAELYVSQPKALVRIASQALHLRQREQTRPAKATQMGTLFMKQQHQRRRGRRGDATNKGTTTNRLPKDPAHRERLLAADKYGWFRETRRRERRAFVRDAGRQLLMQGVCIVGICRILHCSLRFFYRHCDIDEAEAMYGWVRRRRHGSRTGLPDLGVLAEHDCCALGCNKLFGRQFLQEQLDQWRAAGTRQERYDVLISFVYDSTTGHVTARCARSAYLHLGVSEYLWNKIKDLANMTLAEQEELRRHGLEGVVPHNKLAEHLHKIILQEFDLATLSRPDDNTVRPNSSNIKGIPGLIKYIKQRRPELVATSNSTVRSKIRQWLVRNNKQLMAWARDHNVCRLCLELQQQEMVETATFKAAVYTLRQLNKQDADLLGDLEMKLSDAVAALTSPVDGVSTDLAHARQAAIDRRKRLEEVYTRQAAHMQNDLDIRDLVLAFLAALDKTFAYSVSDGVVDAVTMFVAYIDDKTAYNLYYLSHDCRAGLERYICHLNGQVNARTGSMKSYICPAWAGSKTSSIICNELLLNALQELEKSDLLSVKVMDGGPLNKAAPVALHFSQLLTDTCIVAINIFIFLWALHSKNDCDANFGLQQMLMKALALIVGEDDLLRMCCMLPQHETDPSRQHGGLILDPRALIEFDGHTKGRYNEMAGLSFLDMHIATCCNHALVDTVLEGLEKVPLGLPGRWQGMTVADLVRRLIAPKQGYCRIMHKPDSQPIDLPVYKPTPQYVAPQNRSELNLNRGYTPNTVSTLGYNCCAVKDSAQFLSVMRTQSLQMGDGQNLEARAQQTWPNGQSYDPHADPDGIRRRNTVAFEAESVGVSPPEAMVNAFKGKPADTVDQENVVRHHPGETTDAFPLKACGGLFRETVEDYNGANSDKAKPAFLSELFLEMVKYATKLRTGREMTLEETMHSAMTRDEAVAAKKILSELKTALIPGTNITAPRPVPTVFNLFRKEQEAKIALAEPTLPLSAPRGGDSVKKRVNDEWRLKYKGKPGPQARELKHLIQEQERLKKQNDADREEWQETIRQVNALRAVEAPEAPQLRLLRVPDNPDGPSSDEEDEDDRSTGAAAESATATGAAVSTAARWRAAPPSIDKISVSFQAPTRPQNFGPSHESRMGITWKAGQDGRGAFITGIAHNGVIATKLAIVDLVSKGTVLYLDGIDVGGPPAVFSATQLRNASFDSVMATYDQQCDLRKSEEITLHFVYETASRPTKRMRKIY